MKAHSMQGEVAIVTGSDSGIGQATAIAFAREGADVAIINTGLEFANDLGLFAEEADSATGAMLGNFPQTFVHAASMGAVLDLKTAMQSAAS